MALIATQTPFGETSTMFIYLIGSLRNPEIPKIGVELRKLGHEVFDDWHGAGPNADDEWQRYERERGRSYREAITGAAARTIYNFDKSNLDKADAGVLILPAGKSGHMEMGYLVGRRKLTCVLFPGEPERYDVMYQFADHLCFSTDDLLNIFSEPMVGYHKLKVTECEPSRREQPETVIETKLTLTDFSLPQY